MCKGRCAVLWPPLMLLSIVALVYVVFMGWNLIPQMERAFSDSPPAKDANDPNDYVPAKSEILGLVIAFHALFVMVLLSFTRASFTSPGHIPPTDYWKAGLFKIPESHERELKAILTDTTLTAEQLKQKEAFIKRMLLAERKLRPKDKQAVSANKKTLRYCSWCEMYKPDRTHHCRICRRCILRMDHHCPWIANCVGFHNYKFFCLLLFYGWSSCLFVMVGMMRRMMRAFRPVLDGATFVRLDLPVIIVFIMCTFLFCALFVFFLFHISMVFNSTTTIELREKRNSKNPLVAHRWRVANLKFNRGSKFANFQHVFGSWWMWFFPIESNLTNTNGTYSEVEQMNPQCFQTQKSASHEEQKVNYSQVGASNV